jgi:hypothetical protein
VWGPSHIEHPKQDYSQVAKTPTRYSHEQSNAQRAQHAQPNGATIVYLGLAERGGGMGGKRVSSLVILAAQEESMNLVGKYGRNPCRLGGALGTAVLMMLGLMGHAMAQSHVSPPPPDAVEKIATDKDETTAVQPGRDVPAPQDFDLASLPPIESISAGTNIHSFMQPGVPAELTRAALRRAWVSEPAIRDFIGISENQWDFTDPTAIPGSGR